MEKPVRILVPYAAVALALAAACSGGAAPATDPPSSPSRPDTPAATAPTVQSPAPAPATVIANPTPEPTASRPPPNTQGMLIELGFVAERLVGYRIRPVVIRAHDAVLRWPYRPELVDPAAEGRPVLDRVWEAQDRLSPR